MTWTYTPGWLLSATGTTLSMVAVRTLIGDTDSTDQQLPDETLYYVLSIESTITYAAAAACDLLAGKYARKVSTTIGETSVANETLMKHYVDLANRIRAGGAGGIPGGTGGGVILADAYVGGQSVADKEALDDDDDNNQPDFRIGQDDFPGNESD